MTRALVAAAIMAAALTAPAHANPDHTPACANEDSPGRCVWARVTWETVTATHSSGAPQVSLCTSRMPVLTD